MIEEMRERALVLVVAIAVAIGVGFDLQATGVERPERLPIPGRRIIESAAYCPPPLGSNESTAQVSLASSSKGTVAFSFEPQVPGKLMELHGPAARVLKTNRPAAPVGYGKQLDASSTMQTYGKILGAAAARCSHVASQKWFFPEGSTALGFDERLILYNPFPDEAVARITFLTPVGDISKARLAEGIAVPSGEARTLQLADFVQPEKMLGAEIRMGRGRIIAWRASLIDAKEQPAGLQLTLGAPATASTWYLPAGSVEEGIDERINLLNPTNEEALVSISLVGATQTFQPPKLAEVKVPPRSAMRLPMSDYVGRGAKDLGGVAAIVTSTNDVGIVAERTIWYDLASVSGVSSEVGAAVARDQWLVAPALLKPVTDTVLLLNPGTKRVTVSIAVLDDEAPAQRPRKLREIVLKPSTRRRIELRAGTGTLLVKATGSVVVERSATAGRDASAVLGTPR